MKYFALIDYEFVEALGEFSDFSSAAEEADRSNPYASVNAVWSEDSLRTVIANAQDALERSKK